jgi:hypothetical protein
VVSKTSRQNFPQIPAARLNFQFLVFDHRQKTARFSLRSRTIFSVRPRLMECSHASGTAYAPSVDARDLEHIMKLRGMSHDQRRINMGEESDVEYWVRMLGVTKERLAEVVEKVGDSLEAVRRELSSTKARAP